MNNTPITIHETVVEPGTKEVILIPAPNINVQFKLNVPIHVFHGKKAGPKVFIIASIHGDELNGIEILRRVHHFINVKHIHGTVVTVPIANIYGVLTQSRYLPDGRDLNRAFPGRQEGTLAARMADGIMRILVSQFDFGIDLHTGAVGRINMPQLRVNLETPGTKELAHAFDVPVILDSKLRDGSLRQAASEHGVPLLVYEGGEALRFNEICIRAGVRGIKNILHYLKILTSPSIKESHQYKSVITKTSRWVRASVSGLVQPVGDTIARSVKKGDLLAYIHDPFLINPSVKVLAPFDGIVIGQALKTMASDGDPLYHIASFKKLAGVAAYIDEFREEIINVDSESPVVTPH